VIKKILYTIAFSFFVHTMIAAGALAHSAIAAAKPATTLEKLTTAAVKPAAALYGTASYYGGKLFHGKKAANGEIFNQHKLTAACNVLPLNTWIRVTNLKNGRSVILKVTDRLHPRMKRVVDLSKSAAQQLGYINAGLTKVKVEPLGKSKPV
jgi:rare lipoprotein A